MKTATTSVLALAVSSVLAANSRDQVTNLPGWGKPPTNHYSGFVEVDAATDSNLFYYMVEAQEDAANAPVIWWMNGQ